MSVGVLIGFKWFPEKYNIINSRIQLLCTAGLIFSMGVSLGNRPNLFEEITELGFESIVLAIIPIILSIIFVYILTKKFMEAKDDNNSNS